MSRFLSRKTKKVFSIVKPPIMLKKLTFTFVKKKKKKNYSLLMNGTWFSRLIIKVIPNIYLKYDFKYSNNDNIN